MAAPSWCLTQAGYRVVSEILQVQQHRIGSVADFADAVSPSAAKTLRIRAGKRNWTIGYRLETRRRVDELRHCLTLGARAYTDLTDVRARTSLVKSTGLRPAPAV